MLELLRETSEVCQAVRQGELAAETAADAIQLRLQEADFVPPGFGLADPDRQCTDASFFQVLEMLRWAKKQAPPEIGKLTHEGLTLFLKKRFAKGEFELAEELKHYLAKWPVFGHYLRTPEPTRY